MDPLQLPSPSDDDSVNSPAPNDPLTLLALSRAPSPAPTVFLLARTLLPSMSSRVEIRRRSEPLADEGDREEGDGEDERMVEERVTGGEGCRREEGGVKIEPERDLVEASDSAVSDEDGCEMMDGGET